MKKALGTADDLSAANGDTILNRKQALGKANEWFEQQESGGVGIDPNIAVRDAIELTCEAGNAALAR
ncbi:hypothetical protein [Sphingobium baderi]|uniref:Uncharacterized protein n=1 Tax=Sphingobium baderi LL03 TaxID=1114964 RepID=T0I2W2_9SPHN|nr:hypothetical protein [Sphingobium baderi]EQB03984.1 hypothetical protein L485_04680 [Sphingobium baderi LL03]KMS63238.1 hypothetical protein V475_05215 [Sphingobium baderi LL03]